MLKQALFHSGLRIRVLDLDQGDPDSNPGLEVMLPHRVVGNIKTGETFVCHFKLLGVKKFRINVFFIKKKK